MTLATFMSADRAVLFNDAPNLLMSGAQSTRCWIGEEDAVVTDAGGGQALVRRTVARYRRGAITDPAIGASVTLGSDSYKVRDVQFEGDGGIVALVVSRA